MENETRLKLRFVCLPLIICLLMICLTVESVPREESLSNPAELFGVLDYHIPGLHNQIEVVCHIFLRCKEHEGLVDVQGFAIIEGVKEVHLLGGPQLSEPWKAHSQNLTVSFHSASRSRIATFSVLEADLYPEVRPKVLTLTVKRELFENVFWLSFNEATRLTAIGDGLSRRCAPEENIGGKKAAISLPPPFQLPAMVVATLIRFHLQYHMAIGFDHEVLYCRRSNAVNATTFIQEAVANKRLFLLSWTGIESGISMPNADNHNGHPLSYYDQSIVLNHALLSYWGRSTYVLFLDLDEYFYIPRGTRITELYQMHGCLENVRHQAKIRRFITVCRRCNGESEWKSWVRTGDLSILSRYDSLWRLQTSNFSDQWDLKSIVDPDVTRHYHVHWGSPVNKFIEDDKALEGLADIDCAVIAHFMHLFMSRKKISSRGRKDVEALQAILADENASGYTKLNFSMESSSLESQSTKYRIPSAALEYIIKISRKGVIEDVIDKF